MTSGKGPINSFGITNFLKFPKLNLQKSNEVVSSTPIQIVGDGNTVDRKSLDLQSPYASMGVSFTQLKSVDDIALDLIEKEFPKLKPMTPELAKGLSSACTNFALKECPQQYMQELALANPDTALHAEQIMNKFLG